MAKSLRRKLRQMNRDRILSDEERIQQVLDDRTERLAARSDMQEAPSADAPRVLVCGAGREHFGIAIASVAEVLPFQDCMPIPDGPPGLIGIFGRSGRLVSVIDLAVALGMPPAPAEDEGRHLVLLRREQPQVALRVDRAHAVSAITLLSEDETGGFRTDAVTGYARTQSGFADRERILSLLDIDRLLRPFLPSTPVPGV